MPLLHDMIPMTPPVSVRRPVQGEARATGKGYRLRSLILRPGGLLLAPGGFWRGLDLGQGHARPEAAHVVRGQARLPEQAVRQQQGKGDQRQPGQPQ